MSDPIVVEHLAVRFGSVEAVRDVSLSVPAGQITVLLGPNGAGKTTTIECIEGFLRPDRGVVRVLGRDPYTETTTVHRSMGIMLQQGGIHTGIRPLEALELYASFYRDPREPRELLELVGLAERTKSAWRTLSGGEQQRLALALALVGRPEVLVLDEPTAGVDLGGRQLLRRLIAGLRDDGLAVLLTTHDLVEAEELADRIVVIDRGAVIATGTVEEMLASRADDDVRFRARPALPVDELAEQLGAPVSEVEAGLYVIGAAPEPQLVAAVTNWLAGHDELLGDLVAGRRGLEEVFMRLTSEVEADEPRGRRRRR